MIPDLEDKHFPKILIVRKITRKRYENENQKNKESYISFISKHANLIHTTQYRTGSKGRYVLLRTIQLEIMKRTDLPR